MKESLKYYPEEKKEPVQVYIQKDLLKNFFKNGIDFGIISTAFAERIFGEISPEKLIKESMKKSLNRASRRPLRNFPINAYGNL